MRKRTRMSTSVQPPMTAVISSNCQTTMSYHLACEKDDAVIDDNWTATAQSAGGIPLLGTYECILDECPKFKHYGNAVHIRQSIRNDAQHLSLHGWKTYSESFEREAHQCNVFEPTKVDQQWSIAATFSGLSFNTTTHFGLGETAALIPWQSWAGSQFRRSLQQQALLNFMPKLGNGLNLSVILLEWADTRKMLLGAITAFRATLRALLEHGTQAIKDAWKRLCGMSIKDWTKASASSWLGQVFGVIPLVNDLRLAIENVYSFRKTVERFLKQAGKRRTLHWSANVPAADLFDSAGLTMPSNDGWTRNLGTQILQPLWYARSVTSGLLVSGTNATKVKRCRYTATCDHKYHVGYLGLWPKILLAFEHFGVKLSMADIWEKVPFSFVVDWFYDVGRLLEPLRFDNVPVTIEISDFCDSLQYWLTQDSQIESFKLYAPDGRTWPDDLRWSHGTANQCSAASATERCYYRLRSAPSPKTEWLDEHGKWRLPDSGWHIITSTALIFQRWA